MTPAIAIIGMACCYPDAHSPGELWENCLAQRRAFRRLPPERLRLEDYLSRDRNDNDSIYHIEAGLIEGYEFDRVRFRVAGSTFRSADLAHWLALDIASRALSDAGFVDGEGLPRETTGVILGNTLTGEFSRANSMRLRWPYVRRVIEPSLIEKGWSPEQRHTFLEEVEVTYKKPFPPVVEETLAGSLSNTIAGRICNHFDLGGGGYTVDGACASSLLAVTTACSGLVAGDYDIALAGGVDISLDPFELVGFARNDALAPDEMRVYDARSSGFWPGEGCGFVVLMRREDAMTQGRRIYAEIRGWGISSDGSGGLTRPEIEGQLLALQRAYRKANFTIGTVTYFEGHGTGTSVGDATELRALARARREAAPDAPPAYIGSVKANIGHTKAAAGVAGLIKATMALHNEVLPPTTGCREPHPELACKSPALSVLDEGRLWPSDKPLRAGVSAMGFGGINTHVVLEKISARERKTLDARERAIIASPQDAELFLLGASDTADLKRQVEHLSAIALRISRAELTDLASRLESSLDDCRVRAAVIASTPAELRSRLELLNRWLTDGVESQLNIREGAFLSKGACGCRIGFLFPGQGSRAQLSGGALRRRFDFVRELYERVGLPESGDGISTEIAQPAIITASLAALSLLDRLGIKARVAVGHSLGELAALHWAGGFDEEALLRIVTARGKAMAELGSPTGAMASICAGRKEVEALLDGDPVVIAGLNSPLQTVISGDAKAVAAILARSREMGLTAVSLPVSHAFHSPLVRAAVPLLEECLWEENIYPLRGRVVSTITGALLAPDADLRASLGRQVTSPVRFEEAVTQAAKDVDLFIEAGPGEVLAEIVREFLDVPVVALDAGGPSLEGLLKAAGAAFVSGVPVNHAALFAGRLTKPFDLDWRPRFFVNPCEMSPIPYAFTRSETGEIHKAAGAETKKPDKVKTRVESSSHPPASSILDIVRNLVAQRAELPLSVVKDSNHLLSDLHLNSITVSRIVTEAARCLSLPRPVSPTDYADVTIAQVAEVLEEMSRTGGSTEADAETRLPAGVDTWIRTFTVEMIERPRPARSSPVLTGARRIIAPSDHPIAGLLERELKLSDGSDTIVVCLPPEPDESHIELLLEGARAVLDCPEPARFVLVQSGGGAASFARTLHLENPRLTTCVIDLPPDAGSLDRVLAEIRAGAGFSEAHYDRAGRRREPVLRLFETGQADEEIPLGPSDVLVVTGGGKGITAECALSLARETGVFLVLLGLSDPEADIELAANLERFESAGIGFKYFAADITNSSVVESVVSEVVKSIGPVTGILHGAAVNVPQLVRSMTRELFLQTLAAKLQGARNVLAALGASRLKLFVTFSSIIARTGLAGESHYGLANEWLTRLTEQFQQDHPECRCLAVEWSLWSDVGMARRIGGIQKLVEAGITPISPDEGVSILLRLLAKRPPTTSVVVTGRIGELPTLRLEQPELPLLRFLERPLVFYPGIELIADSQLSTDTDPYLADHVFRGERLLPAVLGLEAMAQAATALTGSTLPPDFEQVEFARPVVIPDGEPTTVRVAALVKEPNLVEVVLRSQETGFLLDHFRAVCSFTRHSDRIEDEKTWLSADEARSPLLPINPAEDLYGPILFHKGRFQRLIGYRSLEATECFAEITPDETGKWFGRYLPATLLLGDPGARDAAIHAVQACIPHLTLLPVGVGRIVTKSGETSAPRFVRARERAREGDSFTYDVELIGADGDLIEKWLGLRLRIVGKADSLPTWAAPLLGPYIERRVGELIPGRAVTVAVERACQAERRERSDLAIQRALGEAVPIIRRYDGRPEVTAECNVSAAHCGQLTLAIAGREALACDIEEVRARPRSVWLDLLGLERFKLAEMIMEESGDDLDTAATRVWTANECLKKTGRAVDAPLLLGSLGEDGWVLLRSGALITATHVRHVRDADAALAMAVLLRRDDASL